MINPAKHKKIEPFIYSFIVKLLVWFIQAKLHLTQFIVHCGKQAVQIKKLKCELCNITPESCR